jgi:hypothetical protein
MILDMALTMNVKKNANIRMNTMLQTRTMCDRFAGRGGDQIKASGVGGDRYSTRSRRSPAQKVKFLIPEVIPGDIHQLDEAEMSRRHGTRGGKFQTLLPFGSNASIKCVAMRTPYLVMSTAEARTGGFRRQRSIMQLVSPLPCFDAPSDETKWPLLSSDEQ